MCIMKVIYQLVIIIFFLFIFSCEYDDNGTEPTDSTDFFPLKTGNFWKYRVVRDMNQYEMTDSILRDTLINGQKWFITQKDTLQSFKTVIMNSDSGLMKGTIVNPGQKLKPYLTYKYPCEQWETFYVGMNEFTVYSLDETVLIDGNEYKCIHYKHTFSIENKPYYIEFFVQPGIGIVKYIYTVENGYVFEKRELIDYKIN